MRRPLHNKFTRLLCLVVICLVVCRADFFAAAEETGPIDAAEEAEASKPVVIEVREVENSIESYLEAIAINGREIPPTAYPEAKLGDVITFRALILNTYPGTLRLLQGGADWGQGLIYQGNLAGNYVKCRYDEQAEKINVEIEEIPGDPSISYAVGDRLGGTDRWYTFDLKAADCKNLSVNLYSDELYSCQPVKTYYVAPEMTTPEIHYTVSISPRQIMAGKKQPVSISITNIGQGRASALIMETNLEKFFTRVTGISQEFVYDAETGVFITGNPVDPGQSVQLNFDLLLYVDDGSALPDEMILFCPAYADDCGLRFKGRETLVRLRPAVETLPPIILGADQGVEISVRLPDAVEECETQEAVVALTRTGPDNFYDLEVDLDTGNYAYAGDLVTTGFDGRKPAVDSGRPGHTIFSFDNSPFQAEKLTQGGSLRFKLRKKCATPVELKATARFADQWTAFSAARATPDGQVLNMRKKEITAYATPLSYRTGELELRVTPECCRFEPGIPMQFNLYVTNRGNVTAFDVMVEDVLPANVVFQPVGDDESPVPQIEQDVPAPGETRLTWKLDKIKPSRTRKVPVVALLAEDEELFGAPVNHIRLSYGCNNDDCYEQKKSAPCFLLPDRCLSDVYEKPERLHAFIALAYVYKSNLYQVYEDPTDVWATYITPGLWVALPASHERLVEIATTTATPGGLAVSPFFPKNDRRYQAYLLYSPQFEFYHHENGNNMITHRADAYFHYNSRNKFALQVIDQYKRAHDSISSRAFTIRDKYRTNLCSTISNLNLTEKLELRLDYSNFLVDYDDAANRNDRVDDSWALYGYFKLTPKVSLFAEYEYADIDYRYKISSSKENRLFGGIRWEFSEKTSGQLKGGYGKRTYNASLFKNTGTWMAELVLDYDLTEKTRIVANAYRRYEESMGVGLIGESSFPYWSTHLLTHMVGLSIDYHLTSKLHFNLHSTIHFDEHANEYEEYLWDRKRRRDREFAISPKIKFDFLKWLTFDLSYTFTKKTSNQFDVKYEDHTAFLRATLYR